jgi:hypothetical protein
LRKLNQLVQLCTESPNKLRKSNSILNPWDAAYRVIHEPSIVPQQNLQNLEMGSTITTYPLLHSGWPHSFIDLVQ